MTDPAPAWLYDGQTAARHSVTVVLEGDAIVIPETGERVAIADLVTHGDRRDLVFGHRAIHGWRLGFNTPPDGDLAARLPRQEHLGGLLDRIGVIPAIISCAVIAAIAIFGLSKGAEVVALFVPEKWEAAYGEALTGDFGGEACKGVAGQHALDALAGRLSLDGRPVRVRIIDMDIVNAVALPGRQVVLFQGLVKEAKSPDEIAGVLAHEIGHAERRHVMASLIRSFGFSVLVGGVDGGTVAQGLITTGYTRAAEGQADAFAVDALRRVQISPADTAAFFDRLGASEKAMNKRAAAALGYLSSHPLSADRRALFAGDVRKGAAYRPAMSAADWQAVRTMCPERPKKEEKDKLWPFD